MTTPNAGAFRKGEKRPGQGRPKGSTNKQSELIRDMVAAALDDAGGVKYLAGVAATHPAAFLSLVGKVLPIQVTGKDGESLKLELTGLQWLQQSIQARNSA